MTEALGQDQCHVCKGYGHWRRDCPNRTFQSPLRSVSAFGPSFTNPPLWSQPTRQGRGRGRLSIMLQTSKWLHKVSFRWGIGPRMSCSDGAQGPPWRKHWQISLSARWCKDLQQVGLQHAFGTVYHPQSQRKVERMNQTLKSKMGKICAHGGMKRTQALPVALMSARFTPFELELGVKFPGPGATSRPSTFSEV